MGVFFCLCTFIIFKVMDFTACHTSHSWDFDKSLMIWHVFQADCSI